MSRYRPARLAQLVGGCVVLGIGVGLLLIADLGSDGYSTMVNGLSIATDIEFFWVNLVVCAVFVAAAAMRRVRPDIGTVVQIVVVGFVITMLLDVFDTPDPWLAQGGLLVVALPVLALGIAAYLGSNLGAGPTEAAALAWDPPLPFKWSYTIIQGGGALIGWLLGATIGPGTIAVIVLLGPMVDWLAAKLRLDVHQDPHDESSEPATHTG